MFNVPDCFSESQRKATANACVVAGINPLKIINFPIAAAIGLVLDKHGARTTTTKNVLVYDLGGGRLNVLLMAIDAGKFRVKSVAGDPPLGGEDFTNRLLNHLAAGFKSKHKIDLSGGGRRGALFRLRAASDRAKLALSRDLETTIHIDSLCEGIDFYAAITRDTCEKLNMDLFKQCVNPLIDNCLRDGKINKNQVGYVVLMGGSSKIPKMRQLLHDFFGGAELHDGCNLVDGFGVYNNRAFGSIGGGKYLQFLHFTPLSLGVETSGGVRTVLIPRNTTIPAKKERVLSTNSDNQTGVVIRIYQGVRPLSKDNNFLGEFELMGIEPAPRSSPRIDVCFDIDAEGVLTVSAEDRGSV